MADFPDQWPSAAFHFRVTIDGAQMSFQEVSGLDHEADVIEYRHGDSEVFQTMKFLGMTKTTNLVLKKGIFESDDRLIEIFTGVYDKSYAAGEGRMDILVELLDEEGNTIMAWNIQKAVPVKLTGPSLKSDGNEVAIESVEFVHEGIRTSLAG